MSTELTEALSDGIKFQAMAPVDWCAVKSLPVANIQSQVASANLRLLNALNVLEDVPQDFEKTSQNVTESTQLDAKLDLILGMLGELLHQQAKIPDIAPVTLSAHVLVVADIKTATLPRSGDLLCVRLFLDTRYPQALVLYGTVGELMEAGFSLDLCHVGESVQEQLDKLIFRQHRRAIALSRNENDT